MPLPAGLTKRAKSGIYWIRLRVPVDLHAAVGQTVFTETLGTTDKALALVLFRDRIVEIEASYRQLRAPRDREPSQKEIAALAGEFYRCLIAANADEPGSPESWRADRVAEKRPAGSRRVLNAAGSSVGAEMNEFLRARGFSIDGRYRDAVPRFYEAKLNAYRALERLAKGDYTPDPNAPAYPALASRLPDPAARRRPLTVEGDWAAYAAAAQLTNGTIKRWRPILVRLTKFMGDDDLSGVTEDDAVRWKADLVRPREDGTRLSSATINDGYLAAARAFFAWAKGDRRVPTNPFSGLSVPADKVTFNEPPAPRSLSESEARLILGESLRPPDARVSENFAAARRWVPWLCAYTGARVNEITQLRRKDVFPVVRSKATIWVVRITPEAGTVKNRQARDVPLHPHLVEQGFHLFAATRKGPLFYDEGRGTKANPAYRKVGDKLAAWVRAIGVERDVAPNHGWRHGFNTMARAARMTDEARDHVTGHAPRTVGEDYGEFPLNTLAEDVAKLSRYDVEVPTEERPKSKASARRSAQRKATADRAKLRKARGEGTFEEAA